jgi:ABC-type enterobactin transport system permease subunit
MREIMKTMLLAALLLTASPIHAGGPVIIEDPETPQVAVRNNQSVLLVALVGLAVAAVVLSNGSDTCTTETPTPTTEPGGC